MNSPSILTALPGHLARMPARLGGNRWLQVAALLVVWLAADRLSVWLHLPLPGSIVGFFGIWILLETGALPSAWIERGADSLLDHLSLFFVPAMLALVGHPELLSLTGVKLLVAILIGTIFVMSGTALVVEFGFRWNARRIRP